MELDEKRQNAAFERDQRFQIDQLNRVFTAKAAMPFYGMQQPAQNTYAAYFSTQAQKRRQQAKAAAEQQKKGKAKFSYKYCHYYSEELIQQFEDLQVVGGLLAARAKESPSKELAEKLEQNRQKQREIKKELEALAAMLQLQ